jgi:hypothetical protein
MENRNYFYDSDDWYVQEHHNITNEIVNNRSKIPTSKAVYDALQNIEGSNFYTELDSNITLNADGTITPTLQEGYYLLHKQCFKCDSSCKTCQKENECTTCDDSLIYDGGKCKPMSLVSECKEVSKSRCVSCSFWHAPNKEGTACEKCIEGYEVNEEGLSLGRLFTRIMKSYITPVYICIYKPEYIYDFY